MRVAIDTENDKQIVRFIDLLLKHGYEFSRRGGADVTSALEEFAAGPPRPAEPGGLGAVVEDDRGVRWVRTEPKNGMTNPWQATLHVAESDEVRSLQWAEVVAVKVLSKGVPQ